MCESNSFTSLLDLVDSHLSKKNLQGLPSDNVSSKSSKSVMIPLLNGVYKNSSESNVISPEERLTIPEHSVSDSPIHDVLVKQISNMLRAKELKEQEEKERLNKEMNKLTLLENKNDEYEIDLLTAIKTPIKKVGEEVLSSSNSSESLLFEENNKLYDYQSESSDIEEPLKGQYLQPLLACQADFSYILKQNIEKVKCSSFGKVFTAKLKPKAVPYLQVKVPPNKILRYTFDEKSPCDLIKEKLQKPTTYDSGYANIMDIVMGSCDF